MSTYRTSTMFLKDVRVYESFVNRKITPDFIVEETGVLEVSPRYHSGGDKRYFLNIPDLNDDQMTMMRHFELNQEDYLNNHSR